ncbi:hypothetical protein Verru16b_02614 [Lacunisphaera limnophila]|uniref:Uncharacterized protein n=1 Tax=Lacunisphaera limnophila TaxID=1838286 RepID=A0A1D8AXC0_9BACT|nr:hypothetical protein Verru16b_02614 [Lacunisphaera limnophila]
MSGGAAPWGTKLGAPVVATRRRGIRGKVSHTLVTLMGQKIE